MSLGAFNDDCPGCLPVLVDARTGKALPADDPNMRRVLENWFQKSTRLEREAFHRVCCGNSRDPQDLALMQALAAKLTQGLGPGAA